MTSTGPSPATLQRLHGGAQRQAVRWVNVPTAPMTLSRYKVDIGDTVSLHVHTGKSEYWLILSGEGVAHVGDAEFAVSEGDVIVTPPHVPHALRNIGSVVLDFLNLVHPVDGEAITTRELAA